MRDRIERAVMIGLLLTAGVGAGACLSPPGIACDDEWCPEGYLCAPRSGRWQCAAPNVCGNGIEDLGEECDDGNNVGGDGCEANCSLAVCGNGILNVGEECDDGNNVDGDRCDANCSLAFCGNGIVDLGEECDDRNTTEFDGCSPTCEREHLEAEPNEDGTPSTGGVGTGNDFSTANANGPITDSVQIYAAIAPTGDEDVFRLTNQSACAVTVKLETWNQAFGINVPCGNDSDTVLYIRDATGAPLATNDDRKPFDLCSELTIAVAAGETIYVHVLERSDNNGISGYILMATYLP